MCMRLRASGLAGDMLGSAAARQAGRSSPGRQGRLPITRLFTAIGLTVISSPGTSVMLSTRQPTGRWNLHGPQGWVALSCMTASTIATKVPITSQALAYD